MRSRNEFCIKHKQSVHSRIYTVVIMNELMGMGRPKDKALASHRSYTPNGENGGSAIGHLFFLVLLTKHVSSCDDSISTKQSAIDLTFGMLRQMAISAGGFATALFYGTPGIKYSFHWDLREYR